MAYIARGSLRGFAAMIFVDAACTLDPTEHNNIVDVHYSSSVCVV